jgi:hypothetical protein
MVNQGSADWVDLLLPASSDHAKWMALDECVAKGDPMDRLVAIWTSIEDAPTRQSAALQALPKAVAHAQPTVVTRLLAELPVDPNHNRGEALRQAVKQDQEALIQRLVPLTDLDEVHAYYVQRRDWTALDRLGLHVPRSVAEAWGQQHKKQLPHVLAHLRLTEAQTVPLPEGRRRRPRA